MYNNQYVAKEPAFRTLNDILIYRKEYQPQEMAYRYLINDQDHETITYSDLYEQVAKLASYLLTVTKPQDRVMLAARPGFEFIIGFFACLMARTIAVPIFPPANAVMANRFLLVLNNAQPSVILCDKETHSTLHYAQIANHFVPGKIKHLFGLGESQSKVLTSIRKLKLPIMNIIEKAKLGTTKALFPPCHPEDVAFLQYTSGSTTNPRGVMLSHANLLDNLTIIYKACSYSPQDHLFSWLPPYHDMGLIAGIIAPVFAGMPATLMSTYDFIMRPSRWVTGLSQFACTSTGGPNFAYELCINKTPDSLIETLDLSAIKLAGNGAEPINIKTMQLFYQKFKPAGLRPGAMFPCYGLAESTVFTSAKPLMSEEKIIHVDAKLFKKHKLKFLDQSEQGKSLISSGVPHMDLKIVNPDTLMEAAKDEVGEIWLHGKSIAKGYYDNTEETQKTFQGQLKNSEDSKTYLRTGDLGFLHEGELFVCGRLKHLIILHGQNYYPQDIECATSAAHPNVKTGCVVAYSSLIDEHESLVLAVEIQKSTAKESYADIVMQIQKSIYNQLSIAAHSIYLLPAHSIPKTTSGKLERNKCKALLEQHEIKPLHVFIQKDDLAPSFLTEKSDAEDWLGQLETASNADREPLLRHLISCLVAKILAIQQPLQLDTRKGFFEMGFDSIKALEFKAELEQALQNRISLNSSVIFNHPNIEAITHYILTELGYQPKQQDLDNHASHQAQEDIAIIGMSAQFPGAEDLEQFWQLLLQQKEGISDIPGSRWDIDAYYDQDLSKPGKMNTKRAGFVKDIDLFDPCFFAISPKAAEFLDPQQRMLLQQTWHALENAALSPNQLKGSDTGVFIGISSHDYETLIIKNLSEQAINRQMAVGNSASTAAGRLSYFLGLEGPNLSIDTACSSSLVAVHQACEHLLRNECQMAIVGGVNALLSPYLFINFSKAGMLSADGHCKTFDAQANGYVRGEGCGVIVLKRLSAALKDKNPVLAVIKASGYNQDGASGGLTVPNGKAQKKLLHKVLAKSGLEARAIDYIECHGTGTPLGDPVEANAIAEVYSEPRDQALLIGSVKTNIGHLEAAAGIAGLIKTVLALQHGLIPAHLNCEQVNPEIKLNGSLAIATKAQAWSKNELKPRYAGVSSFGFSGTNAHVIVGEAPELWHGDVAPDQAQLFVLSAKSDSALKVLVQKYIAYLQHSKDNLADICFTLALGRQHFDYRLACMVSNKGELIRQLQSLEPGHVTSSREVVQSKELDVLFQAYKDGKQPDWHYYYAPYLDALKPVVLPNYPFKKNSYWLPKKG